MRPQSAQHLLRRGLAGGFGPASSSPSPYVCRQCRAIQISASPVMDTKSTAAVGAAAASAGADAGAAADAFGAGDSELRARDPADARFEVIGSPYSLLSISLSASQKLYTRRGTLVALAGKPEHTQSTLSLLSPLTRLPLGIPFLYQRITSSSPTTALLATRSSHTSFSILHLDGTIDWIVSQRNALVAWTGHSLQASPRARPALPLAHWGATFLTGRGLAALAAPGQAYELRLGEGESFVAHPSHVIAYSVSRAPPPLPFRFRSTPPGGAGGIFGVRLQVPEVVTSWFSNLGLVKELKKSRAYAVLVRALAATRTTLRRSIWGDRLFLQFSGPTTLLLSSRAARISDVLTNREVNEIAEAPEGAVAAALKPEGDAKGTEGDKAAASGAAVTDKPATAIHVVTVKRDGSAVFEDAKDLKDFLR
jgi:uncharacterized protein (AIM24 family)